MYIYIYIESPKKMLTFRAPLKAKLHRCSSNAADPWVLPVGKWPTGRLPPSHGAGRKSSTQTVPLKGVMCEVSRVLERTPGLNGFNEKWRDIWKITTIGDTSMGGRVDPDPSKLRLLKPLNFIFPNLWWDFDLQNQTTTMPSSLFVHPETIPISSSGHSRKNCLRKLRSICFQGTTLRIKIKGLRCQKPHLDRYHPQLL